MCLCFSRDYSRRLMAIMLASSRFSKDYNSNRQTVRSTAAKMFVCQQL